MRNAVTLDPDVEQLLKDRMRRTHRSFKETLNQALRTSLTDTREETAEPFKVSPRNMGLRTAKLNELNPFAYPHRVVTQVEDGVR